MSQENENAKKHLTQFINLLLLSGILIISITACENECVNQWAECYNRCPTEEEGLQAFGECMEKCEANYEDDLVGLLRCQARCINATRSG